MPEKIAKYSWGAESRGVPFMEMLWEALKPFPGRAQLTLRLAVVCTVMVLVTYTFRMPYQDLMPFLILFITKEDKVTTVVSALLCLLGITLAVAAAIVIYKCTGDRAEFRVPGIAAEIFVGMYLFRVLSIGPVGWILAFIVSVSQSLVYLLPSAEETVHQFLWLWAAVAFSVGLAWVANFLLFPVSAIQLFQREFVAGWSAISAATAQLNANAPSAGASLLRPLAKRGPTRLLKLLKLSLIESPDLRGERVRLMRMILSLDKITRLIFSYACARVKSSAPVAISSSETAILDGLKGEAECFQREFEAGFVPSGSATRSTKKTADGFPPVQLVEAENTVGDLAAGDTESENRPEKAAARHKPSLFVADAFSNPRHVQFAIKVTLAGMIGYLFYTASDYYGIHTVFYTPLIIALSSTGATVNKGFLRIVGCIIGGAIGLICTIWVLPRYETLGMFLFIVFCVHGLAAWIAAGSEQVSYVGLQIALAFDLGFLQGYGPPTNIDPLRDRFIGIVLGICIITAVFSLVWPESAISLGRERLGACLRAIARLLHMDGKTDGSISSISQREQLELEIASHLAEANIYEEQAAFEALLYGSAVAPVSRLEEVSAGVEQIYVACLPWLREQAAMSHKSEGIESAANSTEVSRSLVTAMQNSASALESLSDSRQLTTTDSRLPDEHEFAAQGNEVSKNLEWLIRSIREFQDQLERKAEPGTR
jgi:multidrug resistance protein MdtO